MEIKKITKTNKEEVVVFKYNVEQNVVIKKVSKNDASICAYSKCWKESLYELDLNVKGLYELDFVYAACENHKQNLGELTDENY